MDCNKINEFTSMVATVAKVFAWKQDARTTNSRKPKSRVAFIEHEVVSNNLQCNNRRASQTHTPVIKTTVDARFSTNIVIDNELELDGFDQTQVLLGNEETQTPPGKRQK